MAEKTLDDDVNFLHTHALSSSTTTTGSDTVSNGGSTVVHNLLWALRDGVILGVYEPVGNAVKILVVDGSPAVALVVNFILHVANSALARMLGTQFLEMRMQSRKNHCPASSALATDLAAALFAGHPICIESVAWSSCQPVLLATFFSATAMHVYFRHPITPWSRRWVPAWLLLCACLSKATAITVPIYIYMLDTETVTAEEDRPRTRLRSFAEAICCAPTLFCVSLFGAGNHSDSAYLRRFTHLHS